MQSENNLSHEIREGKQFLPLSSTSAKDREGKYQLIAKSY